MAFSVEADVYVATYVIYTDPADDARHTEWVHRRTGGLASAHGAGVYLGDTDFTRRQDRFLSDDAYRRLAAIRAARDPGGLYCCTGPAKACRDPEPGRRPFLRIGHGPCRIQSSPARAGGW